MINQKSAMIGLLAGTLCLAMAVAAADRGPTALWKFDEGTGTEARDTITGAKDPIEGHFKYAPGVAGTALKLDGYSTSVDRKAADAPLIQGDFSIHAWVAQGAYVWNWCPIISQSDDTAAGYALQLGPRGDVRLQVGMAGEMLTCKSEDWVIPLRTWVHVTGVFKQGKGLTVYANGVETGRLAAMGKAQFAKDVDLRIGMNHTTLKPSNIHREHGTRPTWFSIDGIIDELSVSDRALSPAEVRAAYEAHKPSADPDLPPRVMPSGPKGKGRFGAYYTKLNYYPEWDELWRVADDPDVLVRFDQSDARVVFWRGSRYSAAWVTNDDQWMADQSVEAWNNVQGCFEHMQDRLCRYSHVRIIESHDARVVVHWRYAPVSSHNELWREDERTGRACWVDEYYYIYPDVAGVRNVSWKTGTLASPRQFQESLPFTNPGQLRSDVIQEDAVFVGNLKGQTETMRFVENPDKEKKFPADLSYQLYNFKADRKPFIIYEKGVRMRYVRDFPLGDKGLDIPGSCNHWPVGQARCDGRTVQAPDRPTHFFGFPISNPPIHEKDGRSWWNGLYGMTDKTSAEALLPLARSYAQPAVMSVEGRGFVGQGFDPGERAYKIVAEEPGQGRALAVKFAGSEESPIENLALVIEGWPESEVALKINGKSVTRGKTFRYGFRHLVDSTRLIVWVEHQSTEPVTLTLTRQDAGRPLASDESMPVRFDPVQQNIEGWTVHVDPQLLKGEHREMGAAALKMLANHLQRVAILIPEPQLDKMKKLEIWIEYRHPTLGAMQYHPSAGWLKSNGHDLRLAKKVHITRAESLLSRQQMLKHPAVILHELAHAYHDQVLSFDEPRVVAAFAKAKKAGIYEQSLLYNGDTVRHYGLSNHKEYFAEGTEAFFYRNDFYPFVRAELKEHDPTLDDLLADIWGVK